MVMNKQVDVKREHIFDFSGFKDEISKQDVLEYLQDKDSVDPEELIKSLKEKLTEGRDQFPEEWLESISQRVYATTNHYVGGTKKTYGSYYGYNYDDEDEDDPWHHGGYDNYGKKGKEDRAGATTYNDDVPMEEVNIEEVFDIGEYAYEDHGTILDTFASSLSEEHIPPLLDALVDQGFDHMIKMYAGK